MTGTQIKYTVENLLNDEVDTITILKNARYITLTKFENKYININRTRFKFDMTNEILECYFVRPVDAIRSGWLERNSTNKEKFNYEIVDGQIYQYLVGPDGKPLVDYYDFDAVMLIATNVEYAKNGGAL